MSGTNETDASDATADPAACPECGGRLVADEDRGGRVCEDCGLVADGDRIDRGPGWRAFDANEEDRKSRVGAPTTNTMHDRGLSTNIDWQDKDAYGNSLSARQREKMQRLRTWDERFRTPEPRGRTLKLALGEIDRMASALALPDVVRESASLCFRRALEADLLPGRSIESVATACVYVGAREADIPRSLDELTAVSRAERRDVARAYRYLDREFSLELEPTKPRDYVRRFTSELEFPHEVSARACELLEMGREHDVDVGRNPTSMAAAAIYAAALFRKVDTTQADIAEAANVSEATIRKRYRELLVADPDHPLGASGVTTA